MGSKVDVPATTDPTSTDWQNFIAWVEKAQTGKINITFSNMDNTSEPKIQVGSIVEIAGSLYSFSAEEAATGWSGIANSTQAYMRLVPSGDTVSAEWTTTAPTYRDDLQGWYESGTNKRYVLRCYKDASGDYTQKSYDLLSFSIGDIGTAGGIVFYDKGDYSDGWRYLEFAPVETEAEARWMSGVRDFSTGATATAIGTGFNNTIDILAYSNATVDYLPSAVLAARAVTYGGYGDWFLPSKDELDDIWNNIVSDGAGGTTGVGGFSSGGYWSSSEASSLTAAVVDMGNGLEQNLDKESSLLVRAIRRL